MTLKTNIHPSHDTNRIGNHLLVCRLCGIADIVDEDGVAGWGNLDHRCAYCTTDPQFTPAELKERGFPEPTE